MRGLFPRLSSPSLVNVQAFRKLNVKEGDSVRRNFVAPLHFGRGPILNISSENPIDTQGNKTVSHVHVLVFQRVKR